MPLADPGLSAACSPGFTLTTTAAGIYRALMEALCYGARTILDCSRPAASVDRIILTSGLAQRNPLLVQTMADVLGRTVEVPDIANATAVGRRSMARSRRGSSPTSPTAAPLRRPDAKAIRHQLPQNTAAYDQLYLSYRLLAADQPIHRSMRELNRIDTERIAVTPRVGPSAGVIDAASTVPQKPRGPLWALS